jgi:dynein heavy chain
VSGRAARARARARPAHPLLTPPPLPPSPLRDRCFDALKAVTFERGPSPEDPSVTVDIIVAMISPEGEVVKLRNSVPTIGNVEEWMTVFEREMRVSLRAWSATCVKAYPPTPETAVDRKDWYFIGPAQCILGTDIIFWTAGCQAAIKRAMDGGVDASGALGEFFDFSCKQLDNMVALVRGDLSRTQRILLGALTVIDVHARDVVTSMIAKKVEKLDNFEWTKQLRYYWEEDDVIVRQCNTRFRSGHEYLGNTERLVITPLTDLCYMTLTGALHLRFGGAPAGPAGTGKTETTKDLAKALCNMCVVVSHP